jgi:ParB-like chromosome segregation protein Spo0J
MGNIKELQSVDILKIKPYEKNAKIHNQNQLDKLQESIKEFGFLSPCLIDQDFNLIAGHGRVEAAKALGLKEVPCIFVENLTDTQRKAYILADNRLGELAEWDMELVEDELKDLYQEGFKIDLTGFELDIDLKGFDEPSEEEPDEFEDIEKQEKHYGIPYQGNKSRIADRIISVLPEGKRLVDLFGGGVRLHTAQCFQTNGKAFSITILMS